MSHNEREPHALGTRRPSGNVEAGEHDDPRIAKPDCNWQRLDAVVLQVVGKISRRFGLPAPTARTVAELAGLGGVQ